MSIAQNGWRTLAESTYGVSVDGGEAAQIPAGAEVVELTAPDQNGSVEVRIVGPAPNLAWTLWYVTASALRFEGEGS